MLSDTISRSALLSFCLHKDVISLCKDSTACECRSNSDIPDIDLIFVLPFGSINHNTHWLYLTTR